MLGITPFHASEAGQETLELALEGMVSERIPAGSSEGYLRHTSCETSLSTHGTHVPADTGRREGGVIR